MCEHACVTRLCSPSEEEEVAETEEMVDLERTMLSAERTTRKLEKRLFVSATALYKSRVTRRVRSRTVPLPAPHAV